MGVSVGRKESIPPRFAKRTLRTRAGAGVVLIVQHLFIVLRIVESQDGMTADWVRLPYDLLAKISTRIINEVSGINCVCYNISSKPPGTIEWE